MLWPPQTGSGINLGVDESAGRRIPKYSGHLDRLVEALEVNLCRVAESELLSCCQHSDRARDVDRAGVGVLLVVQPEGVLDRDRPTNPCGDCVKGGQDAVPGVLHLTALVAVKGGTDDGIVDPQPAQRFIIAKVQSHLGRIHHVREHDRPKRRGEGV